MPEYHRYLNVIGGFLAGTVERVDGKPTLTFRHYGVDGRREARGPSGGGVSQSLQTGARPSREMLMVGSRRG